MYTLQAHTGQVCKVTLLLATQYGVLKGGGKMTDEVLKMIKNLNLNPSDNTVHHTQTWVPPTRNGASTIQKNETQNSNTL